MSALDPRVLTSLRYLPSGPTRGPRIFHIYNFAFVIDLGNEIIILSLHFLLLLYFHLGDFLITSIQLLH